VFAREFFLPTRRTNLPQVPACNRCNGDKSKLEHYLTTLLPFGGQHADALNNLQELVPPRLAGNKKLHRALAQSVSKVWTLTRFGYVPTRALPVEWEKLIELFRYVVRGLMVFHWGVRLTDEHSLAVSITEPSSISIFANLMQLPAKARVRGNLGLGTFLYEGIQGDDNDAVSVWQFSIYAGLKTEETTLQVAALTGPRHLLDQD
jgi:hypothetical protein